MKAYLKSTLKRALLRSEVGARLFSRIRPEREPYREWLALHSPRSEDLRVMRDRVERFSLKPTISVVLPVYNPKESWLDEAIWSVRRQAYPHWELCIADDASTAPGIRPLLERHAAEDSRIKVSFRQSNGHISECSNSALELASGEYVALLDHDDLLSPDALYWIAKEINAHPDAVMLYSNEDKVNAAGERCEPTFKPEWSPDYFLSFMYIGHLSVYKRSLVLDVGGFRRGFEGSQDYDLALRASEKAEHVYHIPRILYHWRMHEDSVAANIHAKPYAFEAAQKALSEALDRRAEVPARIEKTALPGISRVVRRAGEAPTLAVVLTSSQAVSRPSFGLVLGQRFASRMRLFAGAPRVEGAPESATVFSGDVFVSVADTWRRAVTSSDAEFVLFLDADAVPVSGDWLEELVGQALRPGVAAVAPKLIDSERGIVVSAGYAISEGKVARNFFGLPLSHPGYGVRLFCLFNVSALPSECLLFRRAALTDASVFEQPYGSRIARDVALSRSLAGGGRLLVSPHAQLSVSSQEVERCLNLRECSEDMQILEHRHGVQNYVDPYFPRGLDVREVEYRLGAIEPSSRY